MPRSGPHVPPGDVRVIRYGRQWRTGLHIPGLSRPRYRGLATRCLPSSVSRLPGAGPRRIELLHRRTYRVVDDPSVRCCSSTYHVTVVYGDLFVVRGLDLRDDFAALAGDVRGVQV